MEVASLFLEGRADIWYQGWAGDRQNLQWETLVEELLKMFGDSSYVNVVASFNKLKQTGSVVEYREKFEDLR